MRRPQPAARDDQGRTRWILIESDAGKRAALLIGSGAVAFALGLVATLPARAALTLTGAPAVWSDAAGSAWNGEVAIRDRLRVAWDADWVRSLTTASLANAVEITGPDTEVRGQARMRPGLIEATDLEGVAGWPLAAAMAPALPFQCDIDIGVDIGRLTWGGEASGVEGRLTSSPGACAATGQGGLAPAALPALVAEATRTDAASRIVLSPRDNRGELLAEATLTRHGGVSVSTTAAGSALLSGVAAPATVTRAM